MPFWSVVVLVVSAVIAFAIGLAVGRRRRTPAADVRSRDGEAERRAAIAFELISVMGPATIILDSANRVLLANQAARSLGLVREERVIVRRLLELARQASLDAEVTHDVTLPAGPGRPIGVIVRAHAFALSDRRVGLVLVDVTEAYRVEAVRRDFVANVSHELKTPVGAITLLGEAIEGAADEQVAVRRFALSMQKESKRLSALVRELIDLSRLQGGEPSPPATSVSLASVVHESADRTRLAAAAKDITIVVSGDDDLQITGVEAHLIMAITNLLSNAVSYSPEHTTVAVTYDSRGAHAQVVVKDQGIGIAKRDIERIFERFYRVDKARSRQTGGTGLGLAIVKHIATNHVGNVRVWSKEGEGSTFTLSIPLQAPHTIRTDLPTAEAPIDHSTVSDTALAAKDAS